MCFTLKASFRNIYLLSMCICEYVNAFHNTGEDQRTIARVGSLFLLCGFQRWNPVVRVCCVLFWDSTSLCNSGSCVYLVSAGIAGACHCCRLLQHISTQITTPPLSPATHQPWNHELSLQQGHSKLESNYNAFLPLCFLHYPPGLVWAFSFELCSL